MLNELLAIEKGLSASGMPVSGRHRDLQTPTAKEAIRARLGLGGALAEIAILPAETTGKLWTLRNGQHNSFPFIQLKHPLLSVPENRDWQAQEAKLWKSIQDPARRKRLRTLKNDFPCGAAWMAKWPEAGLKKSLIQRVTLLASLCGTEAAAVPVVVERFLIASNSGDKFLRELVENLVSEADQDNEWLDLAHDLLTRGGALYIDVPRGEFARDVADPRHVAALSGVLSRGANGGRLGRCALAGETLVLQDGSFPQPKLPVIGQTFLFSKNHDIPAAWRYGRYAAHAFPVGSELVERLGEALRELTAGHRRGVTWRSIPSERPKQTDLLLAFVRAAPDAPVIEIIAEDVDQSAVRRASYLRRTERVIDAIKAKVGEDFRQTPVDVCVLRKVDLGNSKVIYDRATSVGELSDAATTWAAAEDNLPDWVRMPVPGGRGEKANWRGPPHLAPLQLPAVTRLQYIRGGTENEEVVGLSARDAFSLFLDDGDGPRRARLALRLVMGRHGRLLSGGCQALRKGFDHARSFDRAAALRSLTLLGVLLGKLGRHKEAYMAATAFKLGQLLAIADVVHVGYCADRRGGDVPPVLLGNSILGMAQSDPTRALAALGRRWKPYGAWAKLPGTRELAERLRKSTDPKEASRGWDIIRGASQATRGAELARDLHGHLPAAINDAFRAELLLGYVAGLPRRGAEDVPDNELTETA